MARGSYATRRLTEYLDKGRDIFENEIGQRTNVIDIASHYPYSPVRWQISVDGSRVFPEYDNVAQYNHTGDYHELSPAAGETVVFRTQERPRYVVAFELAVTFAFAVNQSLTAGDSIKIGFYDGTDGYYIEHDGSHADDECDLVVERSGTVVAREENANLWVGVTRFARIKLETPWYDVGRQHWERSYPTDGEQENKTMGNTSVDDGRGPAKGNLPVYFEVTADASTTDLQLNAGSVAVVSLGSTQSLTRDGQLFEQATINTADTYVPVQAYRIAPDRKVVNIQVENLTVRETSSGEDVFTLLQSFPPSKVLNGSGNELQDSNFTTPPERQSSSTVVETNDNVDQITNDSGTITTSTDDPGGFQIASGALFAGTGQDSSQSTTPRGKIKRPLWATEIGVILVKSGATGDIQYDIAFEEDW